MSRAKIAIAGFQHETNTFAPMPTTLEEFAAGGSWPGITEGESVLDIFATLNIPIGGFIEAAKDWTLVPVLWTAAEPGGYVSREAFDNICARITAALQQAGDIDGVYLDLHGAMVVDGFEDGECEVVRRVREVVGEEIPIAVSLDLHGNLSPGFFELCNCVTIYRTYPHIDMASTGRRAKELLQAQLEYPAALKKSFRQLDYLLPITMQSTLREPARRLYKMLEGSLPEGVVSADIALGFPPADIQHCGPSLLCYGTDQLACDQYADALLDALQASESEFIEPMMKASLAVSLAVEVSDKSSRPVVICDPQDNPGAGATGDTTGLLRALIQGGAVDAWFGMLWDPQAALLAHEAGVGGRFEVALGGRFAAPGATDAEAPVVEEVVVEALGDGNFTFTGPMYGGARACLGNMALLRIAREDCDVHVIVSTVRTQNADQEIFRHLGVEPSTRRIIVVKSAGHFLADYEPIAEQVIFAEAAGVNPCVLKDIAYSNLRNGVRLGPGGPVYTG
ncbi:hypothetical protein AB833_14135 [Chromatiales bacterium (ex Bugula neritina AB1)]|nr:hypothetical protein AB833_14135 [Chromatiales bacterium (ex Bugula neritina AB1)]